MILLTLMKGDKGVYIDQGTCNFALFCHTRNLDFILQHLIEIKHSVTTCTAW